MYNSVGSDARVMEITPACPADCTVAAGAPEMATGAPTPPIVGTLAVTRPRVRNEGGKGGTKAAVNAAQMHAQ